MRRLTAIGLAFMMMIGACVFAGACFGGEAKAAAGKVYGCTIHPCYKHPVTGEIEDSGGPSAYETGQGMVEGCLSTAGMLEATDDGKYYLTFRLGLMDYTSQHGFKVQKWGDSGWQDPAVGVTNEGSDSNGKTTDICVEVPSQNCVVRGSMYVEPMGRSVIFYFYPSDFNEGSTNGMTATMVTEESAGGAALSDEQAQQPAADTQEPAENNGGNESGNEAGDNSIGGSVSSAQGLSLSTAAGAEDKEELKLSKGVKRFLIDIAAFLTAGLILLGVIAVWMKKNRLKLRMVKSDGDYQDDEYVYEDDE